MSQNNRRISNSHQFTTRVLKTSEIDTGLISAWEELEARAIVPNAFMSPHFVLPALRHLPYSDNVFGVFVEKTSAGLSELIGVALFEICGPTRRFPLGHLSAFETMHSYLTDFLLDREHASGALREIFRYLRAQRHRWHGVRLNNLSGEYLLAEDAQAVASEFGVRWNLFEQWSRAVLHARDFGDAAMAQLTKRRTKQHQKNLARLEELGKIEWCFTRQTDSLQTLAEEFVRLEHSGWKGTEGTSLYSNSNQLRFFFEMIAGFNQTGRAFFTELRLNGKSIASTANFTSGNIGFAFKVGWDVEYARFGLGITNEIELLKHAGEFLPELEYIDGSSAPDSYINELWPSRRTICDGMFTLTPVGRAALTSIGVARKLKTSLFPHQNKERSEVGE